MKVCRFCGNEYDGKDGENECRSCEDAGAKKRAAARKNRKAREAALRSIGMVKVRGSLGGTYWE